MNNTAGKLTGFLVLIVLLILFALSSKLVEYNDAGNVLFVQYPNGSLGIYTDQGYKPQVFGSTEKVKKSNQYSFSGHTNEGNSRDESVKIRFNDGAHAQISGVVRYDMPQDQQHLRDLFATFKSQKAIEQELIRPVIEKSIYMTGPLMTSKESSSTRRADMLRYIEDQAANGVYRTVTKEQSVQDEVTREEKKVAKVDLVKDNGSAEGAARQEESPLKRFGISLYNMSINEITYDATVEKQIAAQQEAIMQVQTAIANAKRAEQDALTAKSQGEAAAAKAKWEQEVVKAKEVTKAEQEKAVAETNALKDKVVAETKALQLKNVAALDAEQAQLEKAASIARGEGDAKASELRIKANNYMPEKIQALVEIAKVNAQAFASYKGNLVPSVIMGGGANGAAPNQADMLNTFLNLRMAESAKNIGLDLSLQNPQAATK